MKKFDKTTRSLTPLDGSAYRIYSGKISKCLIVCTTIYYMEYGNSGR